MALVILHFKYAEEGNPLSPFSYLAIGFLSDIAFIEEVATGDFIIGPEAFLEEFTFTDIAFAIDLPLESEEVISEGISEEVVLEPAFGLPISFI